MVFLSTRISEKTKRNSERGGKKKKKKERSKYGLILQLFTAI